MTMPAMNRFVALLRAALLAVATVAAAPALAGKADDTLTIAWATVVPSYDNYYSPQRESMILSRLIWDMLVERDPVTLQYKPLLAKSWKWLDNKTIDFELRQGISFHNGDKFGADDVVFTLNFAANPKNQTRPQIMVEWIDRVEKLGPFSVRLHMKYPFPPALEYLSAALPIYPGSYYEKVGPKGMSEKPVGTGPYRVQEAVQGQRIVLVRNDGYFRESPKGQPRIGKIVQKTIRDEQTQLAELLTGGVDWIWRVSPENGKRIANLSKFEVKNGETMRIGWIAFDATGRSGKSPVSDVRVRRAIAHALDTKGYAKHLVPGSRALASACFPEQFGCIQEVTRYNHDPAKAKALLAQAGFPNGFKIDLYGYRDRRLTEAVIGDLRKVGIDANLTYLQYDALYKKMVDGQTPMVHQTTGSYSINDWAVTADIFFNGSPQDYTRDPEIIKWVKEAGSIVDPKRRKALYAQALKKIADQAYFAMLTTEVTTYAYRKELEFTPYADETARFYLSRWK